jgi:hypothetical protein
MKIILEEKLEADCILDMQLRTLSSRLLSEYFNIKVYKTINLLAFVCE